MNKKKLGLGVAALLVGVTAISAQSALAYRGDPSIKGPNFSAERHEEMLKVFETGNYNDWKNLMNNKGRVTEVITEQNFAKFVEARNLSLQGRTKEAQEIRNELGLGLKNGSGSNGRGLGLRDGSGRNARNGFSVGNRIGNYMGEGRYSDKNSNR